MSPNSKDRLIYTVAGGIFIPLAYFIALTLLSLLVTWRETPAGAWLYAPISWPVYIAKALTASFGESAGGVFLLLLPVANFALYALLTYVVVWWWQGRPRLR